MKAKGLVERSVLFGFLFLIFASFVSAGADPDVNITQPNAGELVSTATYDINFNVIELDGNSLDANIY